MATHFRMKDTLNWSDTDKVLIEEKREAWNFYSIASFAAEALSSTDE